MEESILSRIRDQRQQLPSLDHMPAISRHAKISISPRLTALTPIQKSGKIESCFDESRKVNSMMKQVGPERIGAGVSVTDIAAIHDNQNSIKKSDSKTDVEEKLMKTPYMPNKMKKQIDKYKRNFNDIKFKQQALLTSPSRYVEPSTPTNIQKPSKSRIGELRADDPLTPQKEKEEHERIRTPPLSNEKKESIRQYLKDKDARTPGMSAIFSALRDIDGTHNQNIVKQRMGIDKRISESGNVTKVVVTKAMNQGSKQFSVPVLKQSNIRRQS